MKELSTKDLDDYRKTLTFLRDRMRGDVSSMTDSAMKKNRIDESDAFTSTPIHMAEAGSDNFEQEFTLTLMEASAATLQQIKDALARMEDGTYGICEDCGIRIPKKRLDAIPYAAKCVKCVQK